MRKTNTAEIGLDESGHFDGEWGPLIATKGELVSVADLVHWHTIKREPLPLRPAGVHVLQQLKDHPQAPLFVTIQAQYASEVTADKPIWRESKPARKATPRKQSNGPAANTAVPALSGRYGLIKGLAEHWGRCLQARADLYVPVCRGQVAILKSDAAALFGYGIGGDSQAAIAPHAQPLQAPPTQPTASPKVATKAAQDMVQPEGGAWPHTAGEWTDAERDALFLMRHKLKFKTAELVKIAGVTRQAIDSQIGGARVMQSKAPTWPAGLVWRPASALLKDCGFALQPLQAVAAATA
jgi:hypothetical protein